MRLTVLLVIVLSSLAACNTSPESAVETPDSTATGRTIPFRNDGTLFFIRGVDTLVTIQIEVADSDSSRARGLMERASLPEKSGMLFLFDREEPQSFWMANTPLPLDMYFVNADSEIVTVVKYTKPFSSASVSSTAPAQYVVETAAGFADTYGITETDRVVWQRRP